MNALILICSMIILITFLSPIGFEATYMRELDEKVENKAITNGSRTIVKKTVDEWPRKMKLQFISFFCTTPTPNFQISEEELNEAWRVPQRSRMSMKMRNIGRCKMAEKWMYVNGGGMFSSQKCYCIDAWWAILIFTIATISSFVHGVGFFFGFDQHPQHGDNVKEEKLRSRRAFNGLGVICWYLAVGIYAWRNVDAGISYTPYGEM